MQQQEDNCFLIRLKLKAALSKVTTVGDILLEKSFKYVVRDAKISLKI